MRKEKMVRKFFLFTIIFLLFVVSGNIHAQDFGFGFGDEGGTSDEGEAASSSKVSVKVGGEITVGFTGYVHDFSSGEKAKFASLGDVVSGALNFSASGSNVDAFIGLNLSYDSFANLTNPDEDIATPLILDEAYLKAYFGSVTITAGLRKLTWGKADSLGPLDVTNPIDYTDLRDMADIQSVKIARPMAHVAWNASGFSKVEAVFIPNFAANRYAQDPKDRWTPGRISGIPDLVAKGMYSRALEVIPSPYLPFIGTLYPQMADELSALSPEPPDTSKLEYFQAGFRFTTTIGPADVGFQYFYGNLFQPDFSIAGVDDFLNDLIMKNIPPIPIVNPDFPYYGDRDKLSPQIKYNRYHQIGIDYAQVVFGFNIRSEFAVFLTKDLAGDDGAVRNPFIGWSLGFDRDLIWGINANIQCNETVRLFNSKVGDNPIMDCEAGTSVTSTRITLRLSKTFFKDEIESRVTILWDIEDSDCYIIPALIWTVGDLSTELSAGIFAGDTTGDLGQYWENSFVKLALTYSF